jgi:hypothetical protein
MSGIWMSALRKLRVVAISIVCVSVLTFSVHELKHLSRYGHLAPLGLHADVVVSTESNLLTVRGVANVYNARLTNYSVLPSTMTLCDYLNWAGAHDTMVSYAVERWDANLNTWRGVPEWDNSRLFCRPAFEVVETHLIRYRLWPGQSIRVGWVMPAERGGFHQGDDGRFTVFLDEERNSRNALSTAAFRVDRSGEN